MSSAEKSSKEKVKVGAGETAAVVRRVLLFAFFWWVLAEGRWEAWGLGAVAVAAATWASLHLLPPARRGFAISGFLGFAGFFLWNSLRGGAQVAWMALCLPPRLQPALLEWTAFVLAAASVLLGLRGMERVELLGAGGAGVDR